MWHDEQAGRLRCPTASVTPDALPFAAAYPACGDLAPVVEGFIADSGPGFIARADLDDAQGDVEPTGTERKLAPFRVRGSGVGSSP